MTTGRRFRAKALGGGVLALLLLTALAAPRATAEEAAPAFLKGRMLVASHDLRGSSFAETVIYMIEHDETGAIGLVVNRTLGEIPLPDLFGRLGLETEGATGSIQVHSGGPVEPGTVFILHSADFLLEGSKEIAPNLALSNNTDILKAIGAGEGPQGYLFAFGYAGWAPGQLEGEIERGSWIDIPASDELIFDKDDAGKWDRAVEAYSIEL